MNKRLRALCLAVLFFVVSVVPVRQASAFVPPLVPAPAVAVMFATPAGAVAMGAVALLGAAALYMTIKDAQDNAIRIPLGPNTQSAPAAPTAPATATATGGGTQTATEACASWQTTQNGQGSCKASGCSCISVEGATASGNYANCTYRYYNTATASACTPGYVASYTSSQSVSIGTNPVSCPPGYSASGSSCVLANARQVTDDKTCDILVSNGQFATASDLNCPASTDGSKLAPIIRNGSVEAYGVNSSGQPLMWQVTPGTQSYTVTQSEQVQTATQTQVKQTVVTVDAATGAVTSIASSTSPGSIASPSAATVPTAQPTTVDATNTPTVTRDTTKTADIVFPTDYARTGEAQSAANPIKQSVDKLGDISNASLNDPVNPDSAEFENGFFKNTFNGLSAWTVPGHVSECPKPDLSYTVFGHYTHIVLDAHCTLYESVKPLIALAFNVVWVVVALFIVLGA